MIELDPWKRIVRKKEFNQPEAIFDFEGFVAKAPESFQNPLKFSADKIRNAQVITRELENVTLVTLVI